MGLRIPNLGHLRRGDTGGRRAAHGAVELLGDHDSHQRVRQGQRRQRPEMVGPLAALRRQPVGSADEHGERRPSSQPAASHTLKLELVLIEGAETSSATT
jgi:hypothetical protein